MHAVVRTWNADPTRIEEATRKIEDGFVPQLGKVEGFVAYYLVRGEGDKAFSITVCQDQEGIDETTRLSREFVQRELQGIIRGAPQVAAGEVLIDHVASRARERTTRGPATPRS